MSWLIRIMAAIGIVLALVIVIVLLIGNVGTRESGTEPITLTAGNRAVTIAGHYTNFTQETFADGIKIIVDGHEVVVSADQLSVDGETQVLESDHDVTVYVAKDGTIQVGIVEPVDGAADGEGAPAGAP